MCDLLSVLFAEHRIREKEDVEDNAEHVKNTETGEHAKEGDLEVEVCVWDDAEGDQVSRQSKKLVNILVSRNASEHTKEIQYNR